jgi:hypothetical protein
MLLSKSLSKTKCPKIFLYLSLIFFLSNFSNPNNNREFQRVKNKFKSNLNLKKKTEYIKIKLFRVKKKLIKIFINSS